MKKILVSQHYSRNKGNVSLLYTLVEKLKELIPDAEIIVGSYDPEDTKKIFGYQTCEWPLQKRKIVDSKGIKRLCSAFVELYYIITQIVVALCVRWKLKDVQNLKGRYEALKIIYNSLVISPGGHLFTNFNPFVGVVAHFFPCLLAWLMKTPFVVIAQTLGPFYGFWKIPTIWMVRFLVKKAAFISVRDDGSLKTLEKSGIKTDRIKKYNEIVFLYPDRETEDQNSKPNANPLFGITFHHIYYKRWMNMEDYINRMVAFVDLVQENYKFDIVFISMEKSYALRGDMPIIETIRSRLKKKKSVKIANLAMDPREVLALFGKLDYLCATKTHSVVYGLRKCVPTLAIAYDNKTKDFMRDFNLEKFSIPLSEFDPEVALKSFNELVDNHSHIKKTIASSLCAVQKESMENLYAIKRLLN